MSTVEFIVGAVGILIVLGIVAAIVQKGKEYEMKVFLSGAFWIMFVGILLAIAAGFLIEPQENGIIVGGAIACLSYIWAAMLNVKKSNLAFGLIFTTFQAVMTTCFFLVFLAVLLKFEHWRAGN